MSANIVLCSTSPTRKKLLETLELPFVTCAPNIDEAILPGESVEDLVSRLALAKANIKAAQFPNSLIIGCDQVVLIQGKIEGKPADHTDAVRMLRNASGHWVNSLTALCLLNTQTSAYQLVIEPFKVVFRDLTDDIIERYLMREQPYQCAGSLKVEGLGIALLEELAGKDPSALYGLPLIQLIRMLENEGVFVI